MAGNATPLSDLIGLMIKEGKRRVLPLTVVFAVVAVLVLVVGLLMPKRFDASTVLLAENSNIMKPLLEGRAVTTTVSDQVAVVTQTVMSKRILREVLQFGGWMDPPPDPKTEEILVNRIRSRIRIDSPREELIRISYHDTDAERAWKIANKLGDIYIRESSAGKERESREAFDFIDKQVKDYGDQLADAHEKVLAYYRGETTASAPKKQPGASPSSSPRVPAAELARLRDEEQTLLTQLQHKRAPAATPAELRQTEDAARNRVTQLQAELDRLSSTYTDEHPDVRRVNRELAAAKEELHRAELARQDREHANERASQLDDQMTQAAKARLDDVQRRIAAASGSPRPRPLVASADPRTTPDEMRGVGHDTTLSELLRRYESIRDVYQDLLKRRENARVSMELDAQHRGFTLRVQEPAELPLTASSLRLMHFSIVGLILAVLVPLGLLFLIVRFDPRVRTPAQVERMAKVPLLVSISYTPAEREKARERSRGLYVGLLIGGVFAVYVAAFIIRMKISS
jgi:polysaccharide chain length determinant protein (PEP-CTERM system associated)